ncbi:hypothetical protein WA026_018620 [Henosepilachna vigintioctopunctata]|uniref:RRP15-like protein n=1 Tax=Henosepilachna vigintioctopunctata TaxID=420089 RepID=A0AAW1U107_9CUCU
MDSDENSATQNPAWVDSISKILRVEPKTKKPIVLHKAKKLTELKEKPKLAGYEVQLNDGKLIEQVVEEPKEEKSETIQLKRKRRKEGLDFRVKPNILEKDRERVLAKIATKGVVQLFNAVKNQQKEIKDKLREAGPLEVKKAKVLKNIDKNTFLDVLMGEKSQNVDEVLQKSNSSNIKAIENKGNKTEKVWDVLRDNFLMDAKLKDWDKELEIEENIEVE